MEDILIPQSEWENYTTAPATLLKLMKEKFPACTYVPSAEMLSAIKEEYNNSVIQVYANGEEFTAYCIYIDEGGEVKTMIVELNNEEELPIFFDNEEVYKAYLNDEDTP